MAAEPILVVDDNAANLRLTRMVLAGAGYDVRTACDAKEALKLVGSDRPRMILMDLQMPGIDGFELARRLKADPSTRDIVLVALTAFAMRGDEERARAAGCDGYVSKPINTRTFPELVAAHLKRARETSP